MSRVSALFSAAAAAAVFAWVPVAPGAPVTGTWVSSSGDGPLTGSDTASPVVGDGSTDSAASEIFHAALPLVTLANTGDKVVLSGSVTLAGTVNSPADVGHPRTMFRFGLFQDDGGGDNNGWVGYLSNNAHGTGIPPGTITRKNVGNTTNYLSTSGGTANATPLASTGNSAPLFHDDTYAFNLTIERSGADLLLSGTITGTAATNYTQSLEATDVDAGTLGTYAFDRVGFLLGGSLAADQASFSNVDVTLVPVPEPASGAVLALAVAGLAMRRRRR